MRPFFRLFMVVLVGACVPARTEGPTAVVLKVLLNEGRGTHILFISGMDDTPVNVFPSVYRPEQISPAQLKTGETVRVLLDDSLGGTNVTFNVIGLNAEGAAVEQGSVRVLVVAKQETSETVRLALYEEGDAGTPTDGGVTGNDAGVPCACTMACCDLRGQCAQPFDVRGDRQLRYVPAGNVGQICFGVCNPVTTDRWNPVLQNCVCGAGAACAKGQRCDAQQGRCVCDVGASCAGCCSGDTCMPATSNGQQCGAGGNVCGSCDATSACLLGVCGKACADPNPLKCCSGHDTPDVRFPTCRALTGACEACDRARADRCSVAANRVGGCVCGSALRPCGAAQVCLSLDGGVPQCHEVRVTPL